MKCSQFALTAALLLFSAETLPQKAFIDDILSDSLLTGASFSISIADAVTGERVAEYNPNTNLAPASVMKLYPTAAALAILGPDYRFVTELATDSRTRIKGGVLGGNLIIRGGGDPCLGSGYFADHYGDVIGRWVSAVRDAGIRKINGRVALAEPIYDFNPDPGGWSWADLGNYYGAGVYDLNFKDNTYEITVKGGPEGAPATVTAVSPEGRDMQIKNYLVSEGKSDEGYVYNAPYSFSAWISGTVPPLETTVLKASQPDPPLILARMLTTALRDAGIEVAGEASAERVIDSTLVPVYSVTSPPLSDIVRVTNHESVNLYAELLRKHLGYAAGKGGTFAGGAEVISSFLDSAGCNPSRSIILDGSGLSPNNGISSLMTVRLLVFMYNESVAAPFRASLPAAGETGTMKNYFRDELFRGRVTAKTGSMTGVRSFAGYVTCESGRTYAFAMIANGYTTPSRYVTDRMERIIRELILSR